MREHVWRECAGLVADDGYEVRPGVGHKIAFLCFAHGQTQTSRVVPRLEEMVDEEITAFKLPTWAVWRRGDLVARPDREKAGVSAR